MKYKYIDALIVFLLFSTAYFLINNHFNKSPLLIQAWNCWNKIIPLLCLVGYSFFLNGVRRKIIIATSIFFLIRFVWQLFEIENYESANKPYVLDIIYIFDLLVILFIMVVNFKNKIKSW